MSNTQAERNSDESIFQPPPRSPGLHPTPAICGGAAVHQLLCLLPYQQHTANAGQSHALIVLASISGVTIITTC